MILNNNITYIIILSKIIETKNLNVLFLVTILVSSSFKVFLETSTFGAIAEFKFSESIANN